MEIMLAYQEWLDHLTFGEKVLFVYASMTIIVFMIFFMIVLWNKLHDR